MAGMAGYSLEDMVGEVLGEMGFAVQHARTFAEGDLVASDARGNSVGLFLDIRRYEGLDSAFIRNMRACRDAAADLPAAFAGLAKGPSARRRAAVALGGSAVAVVSGAALTAVAPVFGIITFVTFVALTVFGATQGELTEATMNRSIDWIADHIRA